LGVPGEPETAKNVVLNVDDTRDSLRIKTVVLKRAGFEVIESETGADALRLAELRHPDVVLLDVNLPDMSGFDVCRRIKSNPGTASTLVVQISACFTRGSDRTKGLEGGADGYLTSPVEPPLLVATIRSLLRVRETDSARRQLSRHWQATFDAVPDGIILLDDQGRILKCNAACEALLGRAPGSLIGLTCRDALPQGTPAAGAGCDHFSPQNRGRQRVETLIAGKWIRITSEPVIDPQDRLLGSVCILADVTRQKEVESSLRQFQQYSAEAADVFLVVRPDGRILDVNQAAALAYGYSRRELLSMNIRDLIVGRESAERPGFAASLKDCGCIFQEITHRRKDGALFRAEVCMRCASVGGKDAFITLVRDREREQGQPVRDRPDLALLPGARTCRTVQECARRETVEEYLLFAAPATSAGPAKYELGELASYNPQVQGILRLLPQIAASNSTVLIQGETGTGKELLARTIHELSPRASKPLVIINSAALPDSLLESELFGYCAGAFTGAVKDKPGQFTAAGDGTIVLDEIGDLSPALQVKLLRVLQERTYIPLGGVSAKRTNARFIVATHRNLSELVREGSFRADLYYRVNVISLELPPLRQRKEDLPLPIDRILERFNREYGKQVSGVSSEVIARLRAYDFPGNIRELANILERAHILCSMRLIELHHLPGYLTESDSNVDGVGPEKPDLKSLEIRAVMESLKRNSYNRLATARELGIHKSTLFRKLKEWGILLPERDGRSRR